MRFVLASASPRRKELLKEVVFPFEIIPAKGEEKTEECEPKKAVEMLARAKAREVFFALENGDKIVLGADTVVVYDKKILGKPKDEKDAETMLFTLSGKEHTVMTGVSFIYTDKDGNVKEKTAHAETAVLFNELSKAFVEEYIKTGSPMDKAGAYGIQDGGLVARIEGSYSNVVGLPVELVKEMLEEIQTKRAEV